MSVLVAIDPNDELASRESNGIAVYLLWDRSKDLVVVTVIDRATDAAFSIEVDDASPMDVFHHPFAYAAFRNVSTERRELSLLT
jgi:hypothetical protein